MDALFPLLLLAANVCGCCWVAKRRGRWVAYFFALIPVVGFLFALMLKTRCPYCREYMYPGATVCPKCGRDLSSGTVRVRG